MAKKPKLRVSSCVRGDYKGFVVGVLALTTKDVRKAQQWLDEQWATGKYDMTPGSHLQPTPPRTMGKPITEESVLAVLPGEWLDVLRALGYDSPAMWEAFHDERIRVVEILEGLLKREQVGVRIRPACDDYYFVPAKVYWRSPVPRTCDMCGSPLHEQFVDGRIKGGTQWGYLDLKCHTARGMGFGVGKGQRYDRQEDGRWLKTEG
jgi:hypothetical protein